MIDDMKKQQETSGATRRRLIDAFWALLEEKRIEQIRIVEITELAGVHRGTFYEYFKDIYDLLASEEKAIINKVIENIPKIKRTNIEEIIEILSGFYMNEGRHVCLLIGDRGDPGFIYKYKKALYPTFRRMFSAPDSYAISIVWEFFIHGMVMAFRSWYMNKEKLPVEDFIRTVRSLIENGFPKTLEGMGKQLRVDSG